MKKKTNVKHEFNVKFRRNFDDFGIYYCKCDSKLTTNTLGIKIRKDFAVVFYVDNFLSKTLLCIRNTDVDGSADRSTNEM